MSATGFLMGTCVIEQVHGIAENCKLSDKAMQALDRLKSLEGGSAGRSCEVAPHGAAIETTVFKGHLKETIFNQTSEDARRKAPDRAVTQLINAGKIGRLDDLVWTV